MKTEDKMTYDLFAEHVNEDFVTGGVTLVLVECKAASGARSSFTLTFRGPAAPMLPQQIHPLHNEAMGDTEIFLVPVGADGTGLLYEAIFN